ncbi:hypothetical protein PIB30_100854, partial [Stylosanthes scabra]|nr:hypothetical protein [Stylosanthes scabra]
IFPTDTSAYTSVDDAPSLIQKLKPFSLSNPTPLSQSTANHHPITRNEPKTTSQCKPIPLFFRFYTHFSPPPKTDTLAQETPPRRRHRRFQNPLSPSSSLVDTCFKDLFMSELQRLEEERAAKISAVDESPPLAPFHRKKFGARR